MCIGLDVGAIAGGVVLVLLLIVGFALLFTRTRAVRDMFRSVKRF